jgi:hypothetical protein
MQPSTALLTAGGRTVLAVGVTRGRTEGYVRISSICFLTFFLSRLFCPIAITYSYVSCLLVFLSDAYISQI